MKKTYNCRITDIKTKITKNLTITVKLEFVSCRDNNIHIFTKKFYDAKENAELRKIMLYANAKKIKQLKNRVMLSVVDEDGKFIGIGDPIYHNFVLFSDINRTYSLADLNK